jgi:hypothetical protein
MFQELPPIEIVRSLVDDYFRFSHNQPYSFFHETNFRRRLESGQLPSHLIFSVLASAVRFSTEPFFDTNQKSSAKTYAKIAWQSIVSKWLANGDDGDVHLVQSMTLLAIFDFTGISTI